MPITDDVVAIAATFVEPIFSPQSQPGGRQLTACVMSRHSLPATTDSSISLTSRFFLASAPPSSDAFCRQSRLHHSCRIERDVLKVVVHVGRVPSRSGETEYTNRIKFFLIYLLLKYQTMHKL